jgi:hypothetical protein
VGRARGPAEPGPRSRGPWSVPGRPAARPPQEQPGQGQHRGGRGRSCEGSLEAPRELQAGSQKHYQAEHGRTGSDQRDAEEASHQHRPRHESVRRKLVKPEDGLAEPDQPSRVGDHGEVAGPTSRLDRHVFDTKGEQGACGEPHPKEEGGESAGQTGRGQKRRNAARTPAHREWIGGKSTGQDQREDGQPQAYAAAKEKATPAR